MAVWKAAAMAAGEEMVGEGYVAVGISQTGYMYESAARWRQAGYTFIHVYENGSRSARGLHACRRPPSRHL